MTDRLDVWSAGYAQSDHNPSFAAVGARATTLKSPQVARIAVNLEHVNLQAQGSKWLRMGLICYLFTVLVQQIPKLSQTIAYLFHCRHPCA